MSDFKGILLREQVTFD